MPPDRPRLLAVTHELTRTGAPMVLLGLLDWLHQRGGVRIETLALAEGPLAADFERLGPFHRLDAYGSTSRARRIEQGLVQLGRVGLADRLRVARLRLAARHLRGFDLLYVNSATSALALRVLPEVPPQIVSHVHELDSAFNRWLEPGDRAAMLAHTDRFVVAADCVGRNLIDHHGVPPERVRRCYEFITQPDAETAAVQRARHVLGLADDELVVGAVGTADWRKGCDLFLQLAARVVRSQPQRPVRFVWVGAARSHDMAAHQRDVEGLGMQEQVTFVGEVADPASYLSLFDVFCLTSREDPFPLVCLEAGAMGLPVVTFRNGGMGELAAALPGEPLLRVVPYLDVEAMADEVLALLADPQARRREGARLRDHVLAHHLVQHGAPAMAGVVEELLGTTIGPNPR